MEKTVDDQYSKFDFFDDTPFACLLMSENAVISKMNTVMVKYLGMQGFEIPTHSCIYDYILEEEQDSFSRFINALQYSKDQEIWQSFNLMAKDGTKSELLLNGRYIPASTETPGGYLLIGLPTANPSIKKNQAALQAHTFPNEIALNQMYRKIFEKATIGIGILTTGGKFELLNPMLRSHFNLQINSPCFIGYKELLDEEVSKKIQGLMDMVSKSDLLHVKDVVNIECNGSGRLILEISVSKIINQQGVIEKYMLISEDITHQEDTHAALLQSEKLALTGRLAASLAHEINNPLQTSIGCLGLAEELLGDEDRDLHNYIFLAIEELQRSARIVKRLRDLNRKIDQTDKAPLDLLQLIEDVLMFTKNRLSDKNIDTVFHFETQKPIAFASKDQIQQVILNLIINAIDALPNGGVITIDNMQTKNPDGFTISIHDNGIGMNALVKQNLYNPFFTTKDDGLGLGLYNSKKIIDDHDGLFEVESEPGEGTKFSIWLPAYQNRRVEEY